jgi:predicted class III extradiol MEMO1 family dioxygenase
VAVLHYALPDEARAQDDALMDRIQAGDFSGLVNADGTPFVP